LTVSAYLSANSLVERFIQRQNELLSKVVFSMMHQATT